MIDELVVLVEGVVLGRVFQQTTRGGTLSFKYDPEWLEARDAFPLSVSMPLMEAPYRQRHIKPFLANLLPENPAVLEAWEKKFHVSRQWGVCRRVTSSSHPFRALKESSRTNTCARASRLDVGSRQQELPDNKYQESGGPGIQVIVNLLRAVSSDAESDVRRFIDANVFNYLIGGTDAHAKNYSLLFGAGHQVRLAPLYDLSSQLPYQDRIPLRLAMKIGRHYEMKLIRRADWETLERECRLEAGSVLERMRMLAEMLPDHVTTVRNEALAQGLNSRAIRVASEKILKHIGNRL